MGEKDTPSDSFLVSFPAVNGKLAVPLYFVDGSHCCAVTTIVDNSGIEWVRFAKEARVQVWSRVDGISVMTKILILISEVVNETPSAKKAFVSSCLIITADSCRHFFFQNRALWRACDFAVAELVRGDQCHTMLGNREDCQVSHMATVSISLASRVEGYKAFPCVSKEQWHKVGLFGVSEIHTRRFLRAFFDNELCLDLSPFAHAFSLESCKTLKATPPISTTRGPLSRRKYSVPLLRNAALFATFS